MNDISSDLSNFDFCWSCCALEHLGSLSAGMRFIERSLDTLRPGGWAVHTTEFNIFSDVATIERGATVLYRQRDLRWLMEHLQRARSPNCITRSNAGRSGPRSFC